MKHTSSPGTPGVPDGGRAQWRNVVELLDWAAETFVARPAIVDGERRLSFAELREAAGKVAAWLRDRQIGAGDRVALCAPNSWQWIVAALGVQLRGAAIVPLNTRLRELDLKPILAIAKPKIIFVERDFLGVDYVALLRRATEGLPSPAIVAFDDAKLIEEWERQDDDDDALVRADQTNHVADIIFTSGTTGTPKGVMCRLGSNFRAYFDFGTICGLGSEDRYAIVNPFSHSFGYKAGWLMSIMFGACCYPVRKLDVDALLDLIEKEKISVLPGPPALYRTILDHPGHRAEACKSLRIAITGASSIPPDLIERMLQDLGFQNVFTAYALTESTAVATVTRASDDVQTIATTSGRALPDVEVRVVDGERHLLAPGVEGQIEIRGYNIMAGYLDNPTQTVAAIDQEGWLRTGDIGVMDDRGYLKVAGRSGDMFIVGGFNVYPAEVEGVIAQHPAIADVAVIGVPDRRMGHVSCAFATLKHPDGFDPASVRAWCRDRIAGYKAPKFIHILKSLPRNASGKVVYQSLRETAERLHGSGS